MTEPIEFRPVPRDFAGFAMPGTVLSAMRLELSRCPIRPGQEAVFEEWMATLNARADECRATLAGERMAFEASFVHAEADGSRSMCHLQCFGEGEGGGVLGDAHEIDRIHADFSERVLERGGEELEPRLLLAPEEVLSAMRASARIDPGEC